MSDVGERERDERRHWAPAEDASWTDPEPRVPVVLFADDDPPDPPDRPRRCHHVDHTGMCWRTLERGGRCPRHGEQWT